jgi:NADPH:quinone reductase-like Zn-dependent oxidoreductase
MRAVTARTFGGPEVLEITDVPVPDMGPGQLRIRVEAATVNPVDIATRAGFLAKAGLMARTTDVAIGWDVAGVVDESAAGFTAGDRVIGLRDRLDVATGAQADYIVLDAGNVALAPQNVDAIAAATIPLNGSTALQALRLAGLSAGQTLLVTGAAGAVGGYAVELAAAQGIHVVAAASEADEALVRGLGARDFVGRQEDLAAAVRRIVPGGVDAALDVAKVGVRALDAVRNGGAFIAFAAGAEPLGLRGIRVANVWVRADRDDLGELVAYVEKSQLTLRVADTMPLEKVTEAQVRLAAGGLRGRLVLTTIA